MSKQDRTESCTLLLDIFAVFLLRFVFQYLFRSSSLVVDTQQQKIPTNYLAFFFFFLEQVFHLVKYGRVKSYDRNDYRLMGDQFGGEMK